MYLSDILDSLKRRWYLVLVGLGITLALAGGTYHAVPPSYESYASVVLLPPENSPEPTKNPYLALGGLTQARDVLVRSLRASSATEEFLRGHPGSSYEVGPDPASTAPIILVTAHGKGGPETVAALHDVLMTVPTTLWTLQEGLAIPTQSRITSMTLTEDSQASVMRTGQVRAVMAVAAVFGLITVMGTTVLDRTLRTLVGRRSQSTRRSGQGERRASVGRGTASSVEPSRAAMSRGSRNGIAHSERSQRQVLERSSAPSSSR